MIYCRCCQSVSYNAPLLTADKHVAEHAPVVTSNVKHDSTSKSTARAQYIVYVVD